MSPDYPALWTPPKALAADLSRSHFLLSYWLQVTDNQRDKRITICLALSPSLRWRKKKKPWNFLARNSSPQVRKWEDWAGKHAQADLKLTDFLWQTVERESQRPPHSHQTRFDSVCINLPLQRKTDQTEEEGGPSVSKRAPCCEGPYIDPQEKRSFVMRMPLETFNSFTPRREKIIQHVTPRFISGQGKFLSSKAEWGHFYPYPSGQTESAQRNQYDSFGETLLPLLTLVSQLQKWWNKSNQFDCLIRRLPNSFPNKDLYMAKNLTPFHQTPKVQILRHSVVVQIMGGI